MKWMLTIKMFDKNTNAKLLEKEKKLDSLAEALRKIRDVDFAVIREDYTMTYEISEIND